MARETYDWPWPCIVCEYGEKYVEKGTKPPRKTLRDRCNQLEAENHLLRAKVGVLKENAGCL
ncbi:MAG: hypothetical protein AB7V08_14255 [Elusimicrobiales bacterium]